MSTEPPFDALRRIALRIRDEANVAARAGQHDRLNAIADDILAITDGDRTGMWESDAS
ncbi:MAG TPA: hypothetical protein VNC22_07700 [Sporichthya sp.]|nr:hypothetical protein [Sporichthya sp.]